MVFGHLWDDLSHREREILVLLSQGAADKEVAAKLHLSLNTVKWHNRQIYAKLGVTNRAQAARTAEELGLLDKGGVQEIPLSRIPNNLPAPVSSFVGREKEIAEIIDLLQDHRLVTLTGPGGVGKTRLALEVANSLLGAGRYSDGIYFVELAPVSDPVRIEEAILEGIGIRSEAAQPARERLQLFLGEKTLLILLDNFEHLLSGAPLVAEILQISLNLSVLATSREALELTGEQLYPVPPLEENASQALFLQRAQEARPDFFPTEQDLALIDQICSQLDNLPLAIELAAVRMKIFNVQDLHDRLENRFSLLTRSPRDAPDRHRTLEAAIDWSYNLLSGDEQVLFKRLAVFQGSRTIDAVQEVCCFDLSLDALDGLESLLAKNLLRQEEGLDGEARFYLLETLHAFAWEKLQESGEHEVVCRRHAEYFSMLIQQFSEARKYNREVITWFQKVEADFENIRRVEHWVSNNEEDYLELRINSGLSSFWGIMGHHPEARDWIESCLEIVGDAPVELQAEIYRAAAGIYLIFYQYDRSKAYYETALDLFQSIHDKHGIGTCHSGLADLLVRGGNTDEEQIVKHVNFALEMFSEEGDLSSLSLTWGTLGLHYDLADKDEEAYRVRKKTLALAKESGDEIQIWYGLYFLALSELCFRNHDAAKELLQELLRREYKHLKFHSSIEGSFETLAGPEIALGNYHRAVTLLSVGDKLRRKKRGILISALHTGQIKYNLQKAREMLDEESFLNAWEKGEAMSFEEAVIYALEEKGT